MFSPYGLEAKSWKRWQSLAGECQRRLTGCQIAVGNPGAILKDIDTLLEFVGPGGIVTKSRNASLPSESLTELNAKVSHPVQLALKRALLRDYPNLAGIFILTRVMDLLQMKGHRLMVCPEALDFWRSLNATEQYFALLEALLFQAQSEVLGGERTREQPQSAELTVFFLGQLSDRWRDFDHYESVRLFGPRGEFPPWRLFVLQQCGMIEIRPADFSQRGRSLLGRARLACRWHQTNSWGTAVTWGLVQFVKAMEEEYEEAGSEEESESEEEAAETEPQAEFGMLQPIFNPYFPEFQTVYARPVVEPRRGAHIFKVGLARWYAGWDDGSSIWRRFAVPPGISLDGLAGAILHAFKLDDDHLYDFRYRDQRGKGRVYNHPCTDEGPFTPEIAVGETDLAVGGEMLFTFDYGDDWQFKVRLEQIEAEPCRLREPKVIESAGKAPAQYRSFD